MADAPDRTKQVLMSAFNIQALYNKEMDQVTIWPASPKLPPVLSLSATCQSGYVASITTELARWLWDLSKTPLARICP